MKKNLLFVIPMIVVAVLLFMLRTTGMTAHIIVSFVGVLLLVAYTHVSQKSWICPSLEIIQRICYGVALITGIVIMNVHGIKAIAVVHKISAALFAVLLIVAETHKAIKK